jgi:WD40 repeat protein
MTRYIRFSTSTLRRRGLRGVRRQLSDVQKELKLAGLVLVVAALAGVPVKAFGLDIPPLSSWWVQVGAGVLGIVAIALGTWSSNAPPPPSAPAELIAGTPGLPPAYVTRHRELAKLIEAVLDPGAAGQPVAVFGMGGSGKSVLAAALAVDTGVSAAFPDGVAWIHIGRDCRPAQAQRRLAAVFGSAQQFTDDDLEVGLPALKKLLEGRRCLVIVDDLWEMASFRALDVVKPPGRLLFTTRDAEIVRGAYAIPREVLELELEQARAVLAGWVKLEPAALPPKADALCLEAGNLALAVAMIGALVRAEGGGARWSPAWEGVLDHLRQYDLEAIRQSFGNYEHATLLRAIQVSIEALMPTDQQRYIELGVFAGQAPVPITAVEALWAPIGDTSAAVRSLIHRFADRSLLRRDTNGWIRLHDLQFDVAVYQLADRASGVSAAHDQLLTGYQARLQDLDVIGPNTSQSSSQAVLDATTARGKMSTRPFFPWLARFLSASQPNDVVRAAAADGYLLEHLAHHLAAAGRHNELRELLTDFHWLDLGLQVRDLAALLADYNYAPWQDDTAVVRQALQMSAHVLADDLTQLPGQLTGRLLNHPRPVIQRLLADAHAWSRGPWLCPRRQSLTAPGGPLHQTLLHTDEVTALALAPQGDRLITGVADGGALIWNLTTGACDHPLAGHSDRIFVAVISADGARAVTGSADRTARVWNLISGRCEHELAGHGGYVRAAAMSAHGTRAVTASVDATARVWDLTSGDCEYELTGHTESVITVAISADGSRAVTGSSDNTARIWDLTTGTCAYVLVGHTDTLNAVAISADGTRAVTASSDGTVRIWSATTGSCEHELTGHTGSVYAVAISADASRAITGSADNTARVWNLATGSCEHELTGHTEYVTAVAISADGTRAVTGSFDNTGRAWDLMAGICEHELVGHTSVVRQLAISADGTRAVTGTDDTTARTWNLTASARECEPVGHSNMVSSVAVSADGNRAVTGSTDGTARIWSATTGSCEHELTGHTGTVDAVAISADGTRAVTASSDGTARIWSATTGSCEHELTGHTGTVLAVAISADGTRAVTASSDGTARIWSATTGSCEHELTGHTGTVFAVAISADASRAITGSADNTARVWNLATGSCEHELTGHTDSVFAVAISADGTRAVTGSEDRTARVWNLSTGYCDFELTGHLDIVQTVAISGDGTYAVTGSQDGAVRVWDLTTGLCGYEMAGRASFMGQVTVNVDGSVVAAKSEDRTAWVWHLAKNYSRAGWTAASSIVAFAAVPDLSILVYGDIAGGVHILQYVVPSQGNPL